MKQHQNPKQRNKNKTMRYLILFVPSCLSGKRLLSLYPKRFFITQKGRAANSPAFEFITLLYLDRTSGRSRSSVIY